jgi:hypothetical protein
VKIPEKNGTPYKTQILTEISVKKIWDTEQNFQFYPGQLVYCKKHPDRKNKFKMQNYIILFRPLTRVL